MSIRYRKEPLWLLRDLPKYIKKKHTFSEDSRILDHEWCYVIYFHCLKHSVFRILRSVFMADFSTDLSVKHLLNSMSLEADCSHGAYYHFAFSGWAAGQPAQLTAAWNVLRVLINNKKRQMTWIMGFHHASLWHLFEPKFYFANSITFTLTFCLASSVLTFPFKLSDISSDQTG